MVYQEYDAQATSLTQDVQLLDKQIQDIQVRKREISNKLSTLRERFRLENSIVGECKYFITKAGEKVEVRPSFDGSSLVYSISGVMTNSYSDTEEQLREKMKGWMEYQEGMKELPKMVKFAKVTLVNRGTAIGVTKRGKIYLFNFKREMGGLEDIKEYYVYYRSGRSQYVLVIEGQGRGWCRGKFSETVEIVARFDKEEEVLEFLI